jgi:hypothetical protein
MGTEEGEAGARGAADPEGSDAAQGAETTKLRSPFFVLVKVDSVLCSAACDFSHRKNSTTTILSLMSF